MYFTAQTLRITWKCPLAAVLIAITAISHTLHAGPASDNAANDPYADGWQTGDNGGVGFLPWELSFSGITAPLRQPGPQFIDTAPALPENTLGSPSFGLTTSARPFLHDTSEADRRFSVPFAVGDTFSVDVDGSALNSTVDLYSAGNVVQLLAADGSEKFGIFTNNGFNDDNWVTWDNTSTGVPARNAFHFELTLKTTNTFDFAMRPIGGGQALFTRTNATLGGTANAAIDRLAILTYGNGSSSDGSLELFFNNLQVIPAANSWDIDDDGAWSIGANWTSGVPNAVGVAAVFGNKITAARTVNVNVPITVGSIEFDNANTYTVTGNNLLTLDVASGDARINVVSGNHSIGTPIRFADNTVVTVVNGSLSMTQAIDAAGATLTKEGAGTLTVHKLAAAALVVTNGAVALQPNGETSVMEGLSISGTPTVPTAAVDVANSAFVVDYSPTGANPEGMIRSQIISGRGGAGLGKTWNGSGITSSQAAADPVNAGSVGYAVNGTMPLGPLATFRGQAVDDSAVLVGYTRTGDANLDGIVNNDDVSVVGANYAPGFERPRWDLGDFDYNGFVDNDDITLLGVYYNPTASLGESIVHKSGELVQVPEPTTKVLLTVTVLFAMLINWRHRRSQPGRLHWRAGPPL